MGFRSSGRFRSDGAAFYVSLLGDVSDFDLHLPLELGGVCGEASDVCAAAGTHTQPTTALSLDGNNDASGLQLLQMLPGPKSWSIGGFFYFASNPTTDDAPLFMLQDTPSALPTNYQNLEIDHLGQLGFSSPASSNTLGALSTSTWYFALCSINDKGATIYWGPVGSGLSSSSITTVTNSFVPGCLSFGTDNFFSNAGGDTPFVGRMCGWKMWSRALSSAEATAESLQLSAATADRLLAQWALTDSTTFGRDGAGQDAQGRALLARGAGTWSNQSGPFTSVTGTIAVTEANDTLAASGSTVAGMIAVTEANDAAAAAGSTVIGTIAVTEANDTLAASGSVVDFIGTIAVTEAGDTLAAAGSTVTGTIAITEAADVCASSGSVVDFAGTIAITEANDTCAAAGSTVTGTIAETEAADVLAASGSTVTGTVAVTEAGDTLAATGAVVDFIGSIAITEANDVCAASGSSVTGTAAITEANDACAAAGSSTIGSIAVTEAADVCAASGSVVDFAGSIAVTEAADVCAAAGSSVVGTIAVTEAADTCAASGSFTVSGVTGSIAVTEAADTFAASGSAVTGTIGITEASDVAVASGSSVAGSVSVIEAPDVFAATGTQTIVGSITVTEANDTVASSGSSVAGVTSVTEAADVLAGSGSSVKGTIAVTELGDVAVASGAVVDFIGSIAVAEAPDVCHAADHIPITGTLAVIEAGDTSSIIARVIISIIAYSPAPFELTGFAVDVVQSFAVDGLEPENFFPGVIEPSGFLDFQDQIAPFTGGQVVTGATSGSTGTIFFTPFFDAGINAGELTLSNCTGVFTPGETITDPLGGHATTMPTSRQGADFGFGRLYKGLAHTIGAPSIQPGDVIVGGTSGATGVVLIDNISFGPPGFFFLKDVVGEFVDGEPLYSPAKSTLGYSPAATSLTGYADGVFTLKGYAQ